MNFGFIQLSDKDTEDFTASDEAILVQLAQTVAAGIENAILYQAAQAAQALASSQLEYIYACIYSFLLPFKLFLDSWHVYDDHEFQYQVGYVFCFH